MTNRKVRDTVVCHFMSTEARLLALCNALNGTKYNESTDITINTLEGSFSAISRTIFPFCWIISWWC